MSHASEPLVATEPKKKKRRVFLWFFLIVNALFLLWVITGITSAGGDPTDCGSLTLEQCNAASDVGTGIGVVIIVVFWMVVGFFLGLGYGIYRLARRP